MKSFRLRKQTQQVVMYVTSVIVSQLANSTEQNSTVQYSTVQYSTVQYSRSGQSWSGTCHNTVTISHSIMYVEYAKWRSYGKKIYCYQELVAHQLNGGPNYEFLAKYL